MTQALSVPKSGYPDLPNTRMHGKSPVSHSGAPGASRPLKLGPIHNHLHSHNKGSTPQPPPPMKPCQAAAERNDSSLCTHCLVGSRAAAVAKAPRCLPERSPERQGWLCCGKPVQMFHLCVQQECAQCCRVRALELDRCFVSLEVHSHNLAAPDTGPVGFLGYTD